MGDGDTVKAFKWQKRGGNEKLGIFGFIENPDVFEV